MWFTHFNFFPTAKLRLRGARNRHFLLLFSSLPAVCDWLFVYPISQRILEILTQNVQHMIFRVYPVHHNPHGWSLVLVSYSNFLISLVLRLCSKVISLLIEPTVTVCFYIFWLSFNNLTEDLILCSQLEFDSFLFVAAFEYFCTC